MLSASKISRILPRSLFAPSLTYISPALGSVIFRYRVAQKFVARFGSVTSESFLHPHLVGCLFHGFDDGGSKRQSYVADAQSDYVGVGMRRLIRLYLLSYRGEKIAVFESEIIGIDLHITCSSRYIRLSPRRRKRTLSGIRPSFPPRRYTLSPARGDPLPCGSG